MIKIDSNTCFMRLSVIFALGALIISLLAAFAIPASENDPLLDVAEQTSSAPRIDRVIDVSALLQRRSSFWAPQGTTKAAGLLLAQNETMRILLVCPLPYSNDPILVRDFDDGKTTLINDISESFKNSNHAACTLITASEKQTDNQGKQP